MRRKILIVAMVWVVLVIVFYIVKEPVSEYLTSVLENVAGCTGCPPAVSDDSDETNEKSKDMTDENTSGDNTSSVINMQEYYDFFAGYVK